jgi:2-methylcitrate dehydratase PrpD
VQAARLAAAGANATGRIEDAFSAVYGGTWPDPGPHHAIERNWIKAFPCCLQTHSSIEAAALIAAQEADPNGQGVVTVHPRSRQAAPLDDVTTGLEAKFSIPYTVAFTLLYGPPGVADFREVDAAARTLASRIRIELDGALAESAADIVWNGESDPIRAAVDTALGSPQRPMTQAEHAAKVRGLAGDRFDGVLDDDARPANDVLDILVRP